MWESGRMWSWCGEDGVTVLCTVRSCVYIEMGVNDYEEMAINGVFVQNSNFLFGKICEVGLTKTYSFTGNKTLEYTDHVSAIRTLLTYF